MSRDFVAHQLYEEYGHAAWNRRKYDIDKPYYSPNGSQYNPIWEKSVRNYRNAFGKLVSTAKDVNPPVAFASTSDPTSVIDAGDPRYKPMVAQWWDRSEMRSRSGHQMKQSSERILRNMARESLDRVWSYMSPRHDKYRNPYK